MVERAPLTAYLIGADQKIPNGLIKITFLGKAETAIKFHIKSVFDILGIRQLMSFWASGFLFNWSIYSFLSFSAISPWQRLIVFFLSLWVLHFSRMSYNWDHRVFSLYRLTSFPW